MWTLNKLKVLNKVDMKFHKTGKLDFTALDKAGMDKEDYYIYNNSFFEVDGEIVFDPERALNEMQVPGK